MFHNFLFFIIGIVGKCCGSFPLQNHTLLQTGYGILISGGHLEYEARTSIEVFDPSTGQSCALPSLDDQRSGHTMEGMTLCGGYYTKTSCITFSFGVWWETSHALVEARVDHNSWSTSAGTMLLGGWYSPTSTETVMQGEYDGVPGFTLQYNTTHACSIPDKTTDTLLITGGLNTTKTVSRYSGFGFLEDLPSLNNGRYNHGCGAYMREDGIQVYLVTGGYDGADYLSSTEILPTSSSTWVLANALPKKMCCMKGLSLDGILYMTGGSDNSSEKDEVIAWIKDDWVEVGKMKMPRAFHALSPILMDDNALYFCG